MVRTFKRDPKGHFRATLERSEEMAKNIVARQEVGASLCWAG